jgi:hypothetical protein
VNAPISVTRSAATVPEIAGHGIGATESERVSEDVSRFRQIDPPWLRARQERARSINLSGIRVRSDG